MDYASLHKDDLQTHARSRGLDDSGTKDELVARLTEADTQSAAADASANTAAATNEATQASEAAAAEADQPAPAAAPADAPVQARPVPITEVVSPEGEVKTVEQPGSATDSPRRGR